jgi:hypothetical protein
MANYFSYFQNESYNFGKSIVKDVKNIAKYTAIFSEIADDFSFYTYYTMQFGQRLDEVSQELYDAPDFYWTIPLINSNLVNIWKDTTKSYSSLTGFLAKKYPGRAFLIHDSETIAGKFQLGENLVYDSTNRAEIISKYPTRGYLVAVPSESSSFPQNQTIDVTGETTGDTVTIVNHVPVYNAPARHIDQNGNDVPFDAGQASIVTIGQEETDKNDRIAQIRVIRPEFIYDVASRFQQEMRRRRRDTIRS